MIDTPMWDHVDAQFAKWENRPLGEKKRQVGLGAAVFLASADADYIVAQTLNVEAATG